MATRTLPPALTRDDLDRESCHNPSCDHTSHDGLYLHGVCHQHSPLTCQYLDGCLIFHCAICGGFITRIAVASASIVH